MNRLSSTLLAGVVVVGMALAGCTSTPTPPTTGNQAGTTLTFLSPWTKEQTEPVIKAYTDSHNVKITVTYVAGNENAQQLLATQLSGGNAPDVFYLNPGSATATSVGVLAKAGHLKDLSGESWASEVKDPYRSYLSFENKVYAYPSTIFGIGGIYNDAMMNEAGLSAPQTWTELIAFCGAAKKAGHPAYVLGAGAEWINALIPYTQASTLVDSVDPAFEAGVGTSTDFTKSEWVKSLTHVKEMLDAGCFQDNPTGTDGPSTWQVAGKGEVFGVIAPGALLSSVQAAAPEGTSFTMAAIPASDDAAKTTMPVSLSSTVGVNAKAKNPEAALQFVNWLSEGKQLAMVASLQAGAVPTIASDDFTAPPAIKAVVDMQAAGRTTPVPDLAWPNTKIQAALNSGAQGMLLGSSSPAEVAQAMQTAATGG